MSLGVCCLYYTQTNVLVLFIEQMSRLVAKIKNSDYD